MALLLYIAVGLVVGLTIGRLIVKVISDKKIAELQTQLLSEKERHETTKQTLFQVQTNLDKTNSELRDEQNERVRFETLLTESNNQLKSKDATIEKYQAETKSFQDKITDLKTSNAELSAKYQESLKAIDEQKEFISNADKTLKDAFGSLSSDALSKNNKSFLDLAKTILGAHLMDSKSDLDKRQQAIDFMVKPLSESLTKFDQKIQDIEKAREGAYSEIKVFLGNMQGTAEKLQSETNNLVSALKTSHVRGRYGEIGLRRIVEFAGMSEYCDFVEQESLNTDDGRLRPDLIVNMPEARRIIVDAKVPLDSYIKAFETSDENERKNLFKKHASAVRAHLNNLSAKAYWSQFKDSPDYVIMYLQIESSFGAALEYDRSLIEEAMNNRIIISTPTTFITMLKTIAFSWQQLKISDNIFEIRDAGIELYNRATTFIKHMTDLGKSLNFATNNYNKAVGSLEGRFIPQAKKLKEIGGSLMKGDISDIDKIENTIRPLNEIPE